MTIALNHLRRFNHSIHCSEVIFVPLQLVYMAMCFMLLITAVNFITTESAAPLSLSFYTYSHTTSRIDLAYSLKDLLALRFSVSNANPLTLKPPKLRLGVTRSSSTLRTILKLSRCVYMTSHSTLLDKRWPLHTSTLDSYMAHYRLPTHTVVADPFCATRMNPLHRSNTIIGAE
ncbi:hypothetical protein RSAG8_10379, partial [Rhizoctonia solani AG-8 WAC10335]